MNGHVLVLIRDSIRNFERERGIFGDIKPDMNVKPGKKVNN
ncbi:MAG: hypothetical protein V8T45_00150 [Oscillospiraceae bacterium]